MDKFLNLSYLVMIISLSCATITVNNRVIVPFVPPLSDPALTPYLDMYKELASSRGHKVANINSKITIVFGLTRSAIDRDIIGLCYEDPNKPYIVIDKEYFMTATSAQKEMLLLHELGHCLDNREHCDYEIPKHGAISLMHSDMFSDQHYLNNKQRMIDELFKPDSRCN